ncbi:MAG: SCP2 sterol-binding domain-containing protein [Gammaproteobacteria bacterium]|nr:SCP2 sterol-binding domain-containing protein [Gammaproteobacteria bacterium]
MPISETLLRRIEADLERRIAASETATSLLAQLEGRSLAIMLDGAPFAVYLTAMPGRLAVDTELDEPADARVEGSLVAMVRLAASGGGSTAVRDGGVRFGGDAEIAERFWKLLEAAKPDWEDELSRLTGDVAAHHIGETLRALQAFGGRVASSMGRNLAEYLQEETRELVNRIEVEEFCEDVDRLRDDVARLEARLERLARLRGEPPEPGS